MVSSVAEPHSEQQRHLTPLKFLKLICLLIKFDKYAKLIIEDVKWSQSFSNKI